jgi:hypothetical protein
MSKEIKILTPEDIRDLLVGFAAAIELDQIRVDALPRERFHPAYSDSMWRSWRRDHLEYIDKILPTLDSIPSAMLEELTRISITYEPKVVRCVVIGRFADAASGGCAEEEFETATLFLGWLIKDMSGEPQGESMNFDARARMMQWLPVTDPLRISKDPECGYGRPTGFVN